MRVTRIVVMTALSFTVAGPAMAEPAPPRRLDPSIPRDLETIVLKAIARDPARRYPDMRAFGADLEAVLEDRRPAASRNFVLGGFLRRIGRHRVSAGVLLVIVVVIAAVCVFIGFELA